MTCANCAQKVQAALERIIGVTSVEVDLSEHSAIIGMDHHLSVDQLQEALEHAGKAYRIQPFEEATVHPLVSGDTMPTGSMSTYKPLILIIAFITGVALLVQWPFDAFSIMDWMRHFMAGFFIVFAFFKLLNLQGFADSYSMYDLLAARWKGWGYIYPFVELALGIAYLIDWSPALTNWTTLIVLGFSSIGVIQSNLDKRKIKCACLGDVFQLPMSTVTIVEDLGMVAMAALMLLL